MKRYICSLALMVTFALCLSVVGCVSHVSPQMAAMAQTPIASGKARVIVIRPLTLGDSISLITDVHLVVDGIDHGSLERRSYQVIDVAPGAHELRLFRPDQSVFTAGNRDGSLSVNLNAGDTAYLQFMPFRDNRMNTTSVFFTRLTKEKAQSEMAPLTGRRS